MTEKIVQDQKELQATQQIINLYEYSKNQSNAIPFVTFDACPQSSSASGSIFLLCSVSSFTLFTAVSLNQT